MTEHCPIRQIDIFNPTEGDVVPENKIPPSCMQCIFAAMQSPSLEREVTDTRDDALAGLREAHGPDVDPDSADGWEDTSMRFPGEGSRRHVVIETGYDFFGDSYQPGSTIAVQDIFFDCPRD